MPLACNYLISCKKMWIFFFTCDISVCVCVCLALLGMCESLRVTLKKIFLRCFSTFLRQSLTELEACCFIQAGWPESSKAPLSLRLPQPQQCGYRCTQPQYWHLFWGDQLRSCIYTLPSEPSPQPLLENFLWVSAKVWNCSKDLRQKKGSGF